jgi:hypothetical protein
MNLIEINLTCLIERNILIMPYIISTNKLEIKFFFFINIKANNYTFINTKLI